MPPLPAIDDDDHAAKAPAPAGRLIVLILAALAILSVFGARIYYLTVIRGSYFYELSENNFLFERPVPAPRGKILTADGAAISQNLVYYNIQMSPFRLSEKEIETTTARLAELLGKPEIAAKAKDVAAVRPRWKRTTLAGYLDHAAVTPALERQGQFPGVMIEPAQVRYYPHGALLGHITGFTGPIAPAELEAHLKKGYGRNDLVGKLGIEREYEEQLRGERGIELLIRDAYGRPRSSRIEKPAKRGNDVVLTLDFGLQRLADSLLEGKRGAVIAMDPRTGGILALASRPDYDPNYPTRQAADGSISSYNKATRGRLAPASTFKLVTAAAGLAAGRSPWEGGDCPGYYLPPGIDRRFYCDVRHGHGGLNMIGALQRSCNVYFYRWADQLGPARMLEATAAFGFGEPTGIDLGPEGAGILAQQGAQRIFRGSVIQLGIGQGELIAVTPLQLLNAYAALANGGTRLRPHLLKEIRSPQGELIMKREPETLGKLPMNEEARGHIVEGFRRVVQLPGGTAYGRGFEPEWNAAGKTGSAEVAGQELTNGWFVAFAPYDRPEFIAIALVEAEGHGGAAASPLVLALMAAHFNPALRPGGAVASEGAASEGAPPPSENLQPAEEEEVPFWARAR